MRKEFIEALDDLINQYVDDMETVISGLELKLMALREEEQAAQGDENA